MNRRKFVIGVGSLAAGSAAAIGTGAFDSVEAERTVSAELADDADAYLALESISSHSELEDNDRVKIIDINGISNDSGTGGDGVGGNSEYYFDGVFNVINQGTDAVYFYVDGLDTFVDGNDELVDVYVYEDGARDTPLDGDSGALEIGTGDTESIGVYVETDDVDTDGSDTNSYSHDATVYAEIDDPIN